MKTINHKLFYVKNPSTGEYESLPAQRGESAYEAAVRLGKTTLTEEQWLEEYEVKRDDAIEAIEEKGVNTLASIPEDYTTLNDQVSQLSEEIGALSNAVLPLAGEPPVSITSFDGYELHQGMIASSGTWNNVNDNFMHIVIPVKKGYTINVKVSAESTENLIYCGVTEYSGAVNGESYHLSPFGRKMGSPNQANNYEVTDDETRYIVFVTRYNGYDIPMEAVSITFSGSDGYIAELDTRVDNLEEKINADIDRLFANNIFRGEVINGGYYDDGGVWIESSGFRCAVLPINSVKNGDKIVYSPEFAYYNGQFRFDAFAADGTWLAKIYNGGDTSFIVNGISTDDFYLVIRFRASQSTENLFVRVEGTTKSVVLSGKTINCLGDSFTAPEHGWHKYLAERTGAICNNYGVASSRITIDSGDVKSFLNRYSDMDATADITIIFGGINDSRSMYDDGVNDTIVLGDMDSPLDSTSFYGGLRLLIESIKAFMPGKKIIGVVPPDFEQSTPYLTYLPQVRQACVEVYEYYGIPYANLKKECQEMYIDDYNFATYRNGAVNDYHPSTAGHIAISEIIQGKLENVCKV